MKESESVYQNLKDRKFGKRVQFLRSEAKIVARMFGYNIALWEALLKVQQHLYSVNKMIGQEALLTSLPHLEKQFFKIVCVLLCVEEWSFQSCITYPCL